MATSKIPITPAVRALRAAGVEFDTHLYPYDERGGTRHAAESLGVDEHGVIKTLVFEATGDGGARRPLVVLMHGDLEVSAQQLARFLGVKSVVPASVPGVEKATGYQPGGVSPFGTRTSLPVYVEETILALDRFYLNGGKRGFLVEIRPDDLLRVVAATPVRVGVASL
jgi:Cys-tRNA(Pro) deacylase